MSGLSFTFSNRPSYLCIPFEILKVWSKDHLMHPSSTAHCFVHTCLDFYSKNHSFCFKWLQRRAHMRHDLNQPLSSVWNRHQHVNTNRKHISMKVSSALTKMIMLALIPWIHVYRLKPWERVITFNSLIYLDSWGWCCSIGSWVFPFWCND